MPKLDRAFNRIRDRVADIRKHPYVSVALLVLIIIGYVDNAITTLEWILTSLIIALSRPVVFLAALGLLAYIFHEAWTPYLRPVRNWLNRRHAAGENEQLQFNDEGTLAGAPGFRWEKKTNTAIVGIPGSDIVCGTVGKLTTLRPHEHLGMDLGRPERRWRHIHSATHSLIAGSGLVSPKVGGIIHMDAAAVSLAGAGEHDLMEYLVPEGTLSNNLSSLWFLAAGSIAYNSSEKRLRVHIGDNTILDARIPASTAGVPSKWIVNGNIVSNGNESQLAMVWLVTNSRSDASCIGCTNIERPADPCLLRFTGKGINSGDLTQELLQVGYYPSP